VRGAPAAVRLGPRRAALLATMLAKPRRLKEHRTVAARSVVEDETQLAESMVELVASSGKRVPREGEGLLVGRTLAGRYDVFAFLGAGGMGEVYQAHDRELDEPVAIKTLRKELASRPALVERFRTEVRLARRVTHPSVARVFELHDADGIRFVTMELVEGEPLSDVLEREGVLAPGAAARVTAEVARALAAAHAAGVIHRDIKPDNVLVRSNGHVAVADFGIAFALGDTSVDLVGTPAYMSPEQIKGEPTGPLSDVYALGVTLYELLTGTIPFDGATVPEAMSARLGTSPPDPRARRADLPEGLARLVVRAMAEAPEARFPDAAAFASALEDVASSLDGRALVLGRPRDPRRDPAPTVVIAPFTDGDEDTGPVLGAVREELLLGITRLSGVRLLLDEGPSRATFTVDGRALAGAVSQVAFEVRATSDERPVLTGRFPLAAHLVPRLTDLLLESLALATSGTLRAKHPDDTLPPGALEPWLRARSAFRRTFSFDDGRVVRLYEEALRHAPDHPVLLAGRAMALQRFAFFAPIGKADFETPRRDVARALAMGPSRPEPHLAAGHLALQGDDPVSAARHFRAALHAAPAWPDGHEWLGRMLLEAGFIEDGRARLEAAMLRDPELYSVRWEIARADALDGDWDEAKRQLDLLEQSDGKKVDRWFGLLRLAWWSGDAEWIATAMREVERLIVAGIFDPELSRAALDAMRGDWPSARDVLARKALAETHASHRRNVLYAQITCDVASASGDVDLALAALDRAVTFGLFDMHWLAKSPGLRALRADPRSARLFAIVRERAARIHDALRGG
jgi:serine/threonine protein kinase/tetratricopeptide (TPR) repeat protein